MPNHLHLLWWVSQHWAEPAGVFWKILFPWKYSLHGRIDTLKQREMTALVKPKVPTDVSLVFGSWHLAEVAEEVIQNAIMKLATRECLSVFDVVRHVVEKRVREFATE